MIESATATVTAALDAGATDAEVYAEHGTTHRVITHTERLSESRGHRTETALRVWSDGRGCLLTTVGTGSTALARAAVTTARAHGLRGVAFIRDAGSRPEPPAQLPAPALDDRPASLVRTVAGKVRELPLPQPHLLSIGYTGQHTRRLLVNSRDLAVAQDVTTHEVWCWLEGGSGHVRFAAVADTLDALVAEELAGELIDQAACLVAGTPVEAGTWPVLFGPGPAADLAWAFARLLSAQHVLGDLRALRDRVGRRIASSAVTLIDDVTHPFDDEGTPAETVTLIEGGRLRGFLHSLETAHGLDMPPNGKATRAELWRPPLPAPARAYLKPGTATGEELRSGLGTGPMITGLLRSGRLQSGTGRFTAIGYGWWLRDGVPVRRISGVQVSAGVFELLRSIVACGDDLRFTPLAGGAGAPSVLISGMQVG
ncbi:TldD/PmbA family protein [Saccharothrix sp. NRRL B-16314]|uniref:TldD/PmbA family protein n=1 Tax=Saccharothrix sp. NRRL B-16314 TaxID=1463825 RepID=UPI0005240A66|nr:metallopeptidase TldD-related protein [Saccharothrix sp. NRRL B-16314]